MAIKIIADSTCDLNEELIRKYDIAIVPLYIVMKDKSFKDGVEISPEEIYTWADANKTTPKTAAVGMEEVEKALTEYLQKGDDILFFGISEDMSTTCNVVRIVASDLETDKVHVINSMNLSTGIGLQVLRAAQMAQEGKDINEIVAAIEEKRDRVRASFVVDTLTYLARGGRCKPVTALLANTLSLKPRIEVVNGAMQVGKKYRGSQSKVILKYVQDMEAELLTADETRVFITHSGCSQEVIDSVKSYLEGLHYFREIDITRAGGVISSNCGPGTLGVLFYEK